MSGPGSQTQINSSPLFPKELRGRRSIHPTVLEFRPHLHPQQFKTQPCLFSPGMLRSSCLVPVALIHPAPSFIGLLENGSDSHTLGLTISTRLKEEPVWKALTAQGRRLPSREPRAEESLSSPSLGDNSFWKQEVVSTPWGTLTQMGQKVIAKGPEPGLPSPVVA